MFKELPNSIAALFFCCSEVKGFVNAIDETILLPSVEFANES